MFSKQTFRCKVLLLVLSVLMLSLGFSACGQRSSPNNTPLAENNPSGTVASAPLTVLSIIGGNVFIMKPGGSEWTKAEEGINLDVNYKIKTEVMSRATVTFFDGSTIELQGETEIALSTLGFDADSSRINIRLRQELGETISRVKKLADTKASYEIETPAAVAAVRGTTMYVGVARDGLTFVGNIEGQVSAVARGIEVQIVPGSHVLVVPGKAAGPVEPGATPTPTNTPTTGVSSPNNIALSTATPIPGGTAEPTNTISPVSNPMPTPEAARVAIENSADRQAVYPGDTILFTYKVSNVGSVPLSDISVTDDRVGEGIFKSGDANANKYLDVNEIWEFSGNYLVKAGESGVVTYLATVSGTGPNNSKVTASAKAAVNVSRIIVEITSLQEGDVVTRAVTIGGTVNDPSITQATLTVNSKTSTIKVINGRFSASANLVDGTNLITVTVAKPGGVVVSHSVEAVPAR